MSKFRNTLVAAGLTALAATIAPAQAQTMHFNEGSATPNDAPPPAVHHTKKKSIKHRHHIPSSAGNTNSQQRP